MSTPFNWQPSASLAHLKERAKLIQNIRDFFHKRGYWEVETPVMGNFPVTDVYLDNIEAFFRGRPYYLQTSPEYHMKRLLTAGSGPIFQLARAFRDDELGRWHNPEFCLLEWYQLAIDHHALMDEVDQLLQSILLCPAMLKISYRQAFLDNCQLDPFQASLDDFKNCLKTHDLDKVLAEDETDPDAYLFLLMSHVIEPALVKHGRPIAVYDFPPSQAALAKINQGVAERFEVYYQGVELANGFHELTAATAQKARFEKDLAIRCERGLKERQIDSNFIQALEQGLPECSGVALGIDRLIALALRQNCIAEVISFDLSRA